MGIISATDSNGTTLIEKGLVMVKFYADWCGNCKLIAPKVKRLAEGEQFSTYTFLDVNAEENPEMRKMAMVDNLPYFAIFKDGVLIKGTATSKIDVVEAMLLDAQNN